MTTNDIDAIRKEWASQCGSCDYGLPYECTCPKGDPRPVVSKLCDEIEQLRAERDNLEAYNRAVKGANDDLRAELATARQETHQ